MSLIEGKDYYGILQVPKAASDVDIKKAYRKAAMKYHPDKNPDAPEEAAKIFQEIGEAYDVLSDLEKRAIYDQYGYEGLINGVEDQTGGGYQYKENAQEIFERFFGTANPFASFGFGESMPFAKKLTKAGPKKLDPVMINLDCSLSELFNGCVKKYEISRKRLGADGVLYDDSKIVSISVKPGWKKGTKITFPEEGDEGLDAIPADVIFVIQENNNDNSAFIREGNNLVYTHKLPLSDALSDCSLQIPTLDRRLISLACPEVVSPYYEKLIPGEGMPISKKPGSRGDLVVRFHILFPKYLNGTKRVKIKELLANEELQT